MPYAPRTHRWPIWGERFFYAPLTDFFRKSPFLPTEVISVYYPSEERRLRRPADEVAASYTLIGDRIR